jgi:hypothetical protein
MWEHEQFLCSGLDIAVFNGVAAVSEQRDCCILFKNNISGERVKYQTQLQTYCKAIIFLKYAKFFGPKGYY